MSRGRLTPVVRLAHHRLGLDRHVPGSQLGELVVTTLVVGTLLAVSAVVLALAAKNWGSSVGTGERPPTSVMRG